MSKHAPGKIPKGSKWGVCVVCGYRIRDRDDMELVDEPMKFAHERCADDYEVPREDTSE
jgi:hypothetical protein